MIFLTEVNKVYFEKITESLTKDIDKWTLEIESGYDYYTANYYSPEYTNEKLETYQFKLSGGWVSCIFANTDRPNWHPNYFTLCNFFSVRVRQYKKAKKYMKKYIKDEEQRIKDEKLLDGISGNLKHKQSTVNVNNFIAPPPD